MNMNTSYNNIPVAKRTRLQTKLLYQGFCGSARNQSRKRNRETDFCEVIDVDNYWIKNRASEKTGVCGSPDSDDKIRCYGSASPFKSGKHTYFLYSDESDEDGSDIILEEEQQVANEDLQTSCKLHYGNQYNTKTDSFESSEDESFSSSESEKDGFKFLFSLLNKSPEHPTTEKNGEASSLQSSEDDEDELFSSSESEIDDMDDCDFLLEHKKKHQSTQSHKEKAGLKKTDKKPMDCYKKIDKTSSVKHKKSKKDGGKDDSGCVDAILDSIMSNEDVHEDVPGEKEDEYLPLQFRFDDSDNDSSQVTNESNGEDLFKEMEFAFQCDEMGSYRTPKVESREDYDYYDDIDPCESGEHGDAYFEEQTGLRCSLCGAVLLESRYVIQKLATYAPDRSRRRSRFDERQFYNSLENPYFMDSDSNSYDICKQTKGTVWELIPTSIQAHMYPHQQEAYEFLWKNLAGTIELSGLQTLGPRGVGGGGCIISHAPGTGKTFLTLVFMESFLKKFPKCCPVIVAPACMLLTWEAEFKKWQVGFSFINLQNSEPLRKEKIIGSSRCNKDRIRAMKIHSWINGGGVLGVSYNLFEKLTRSSNKKNTGREKLMTFLLDKPGLVVLDEGHTPRNQNSKIWNTLLKLETKNRVILSGTPFQNNFRELFNTLRIVRPATAKSIVKQKLFANMIQERKRKKSRGRSTCEDIEKLKEIISPFVHVHKGHILESKLHGLKKSVIILNPPLFQNSFIENLGVSSSTFKYEHKVALVSVHPSLILHCLLTAKEENSINKQQLEDLRLQPEVGVKTRFVMELIRLSISLNEKVLIFSQYIQPSKLLQDQIALVFGWDVEREIALIKGSIHQTSRQKIINAFNDPKSELKVLLASTRCCSEGIHLHGASRVVILDVVWNPSVERQAISRAYRLGQKKPVYTYHLMVAGTTEEEKYDRQVEKGWLAEMVFSSASMGGVEPKKVSVDDKILQEMVGNQELKDMFKKIRYPEKQTRI
ncbi:hypothetical protein SSX86_028110 [Deinandra increscens subsp. villosa]|uniref:Uncharacterized protein n=1 Tax=Deinandra increscens subsp. villosa TaxID=3103831 RepID=A0AAP0CA62_9ASTR